MTAERGRSNRPPLPSLILALHRASLATLLHLYKELMRERILFAQFFVKTQGSVDNESDYSEIRCTNKRINANELMITGGTV